MAAPFTVLIPARLASTRLPDKPLADIAGGVDLSTVGSAVIAVVVYVAAQGLSRRAAPGADEPGVARLGATVR